MAIQYGSQYVDEQYKATVLPNLFYKTWLVPGVTYQDVMVDGAGGFGYFGGEVRGKPVLQFD